MKPQTFILLITTFLQLRTQSQESFYLFDQDFKGVQNQKRASYFGRLQKLSDTCWQWDLYTFIGPKIKRIQFKDEQQTIVHGKLLFYNEKGYFDSTGYATNNVRDGDWYYYNDTGKATLIKHYQNGKLVSTDDLTIERTNDTKNDDEEESSFPGGIKSWQGYLVKNMQYPERAVTAQVSGLVVTQFIVDAKGEIADLEISKSVEFSIDEEAARLIRQAPKWIPARQNGKFVRSYKKQPIYFRLE